MSRFRSFKNLVIWVALFAFLLPTLCGFISTAMAGEGGGSSDPMKPPLTNPGGTSYKAPSVWHFWVLNYLKLRWGRWILF